MSAKFTQDGPDFYDAITKDLVASYPGLVKTDSDLEGAMNAKAQFITEHSYFLEVTPEPQPSGFLTKLQIDGQIPVKVINNNMRGQEIVEGMAKIKRVIQGDKSGIQARVEFIEEPGSQFTRWIFGKYQ